MVVASREVIELPNAIVEIEARSGFLFVVESGELGTLADVHRYTQAMDRAIQKTGLERAIIDARGEVGDPPESVREAMWEWLLSPERGFDVVAFVLPTEMAVARVNMTALSKKARVRAFESVHEAQRWLLRGPRFASRSSIPALSPTMPAMDSQRAIEPPRRIEPPELHEQIRPSARAKAAYSSSEAPVDYLGSQEQRGRGSGLSPRAGVGRRPWVSSPSSSG